MMGKFQGWAISEEAQRLIAHGALTNSKRPESFVDGVYPTHAKRNWRCYLEATNGQKFVDFICGLGTNLAGTVNDPEFNNLPRGCLSLSSEIEVEFAAHLNAKLPYLEKIRILKTGSEGCLAAVRIARAFTDNEWVYSHGYHGWGDGFTSLTSPANGCSTDEYMMGLYPTKKLDSCDAAVIVEPDLIPLDQLKRIRDECTKAGAILIFDETITAYRYQKLSYAKAHGVIPDLSVMGKALANGLPISVVGGRRDVMEADYFVSSTFAGELSALYAAKKMLELLDENYWAPEQLWHDGGNFKRKFNGLAPDLIEITGYDTRGRFVEKQKGALALFFQEACKAGLLFGPSWFWNLYHRDESEQALDLCNHILARIKLGKVKLEGNPPVSPYSMRVRDERESNS